MNKYCNAKRLKRTLDSYVMGQEKGTKYLCMAIANHLQNIEAKKIGYINNEERLFTDNALLIGPSGCGKTETFRVLKNLEREFDIPVCMFTLNGLSGNGSWRNTQPIATIFNDVFSKAADLYFAKHDYSNITDKIDKIKHDIIEIANHAIILLDEFDKISLKGQDNGLLMYQELQSTMLTYVEGTIVPISDMTSSQDIKDDDDDEEQVTITIEDVKLDTSNMLFIMLGAFEGLELITRYRLHNEWLKKTHKTTIHELYQATTLGFVVDQEPTAVPTEPEYTYEQLLPTTEDIIEYGFMRELVGRIPVRTVYKPLSVDDMANILLNCKTSVYRDYQRRFQRRGHLLRCNHDALKEIARIANERGTGARGLRNVFVELLQQTEYELSGDDRPLHVLLRGKEIRESKPPLIRNSVAIVLRKERENLNQQLVELLREQSTQKRKSYRKRRN